MDTLLGNYFIENSTLKSCSDFNNCYDASAYQLYEAMRVMNGRIVFLQEHLLRLQRGVSSIGLCADDFIIQIQTKLSELISVNANREGNIKLLCSSRNLKLGFTAYYFPHDYPSESYYKRGVRLMLHSISRPDPNLKQVSISDSIRTRISQLLENKDVFEILLVNEQGVITEGSKSNFFLIKDEKLYTAPDALVLKGITRQYVIQIARREGIECVFRKILPMELGDAQAAFICGTSPKILPVHEIDHHIFDENEKTMRFLMQQYDQEITKYTSREQ